MQFKLRNPKDPNTFCCVYVVSEEKRDYSHEHGHHVPDIDTLMRKTGLYPAHYDYCPTSTLILVSATQILGLEHFHYMVNDAIENHLRVAFCGARKERCFCIPASSICVCAKDILCMDDCIKQYLYGMIVYIKDRCLSMEMKNRLAQCAARYCFTIHYSNKAPHRHERKKKEVAHKKVWGPWKDCEDHIYWDHCEKECFDPCNKPKTCHKNPCSTKCFDDCVKEKWVKEPLHLHHKQDHEEHKGDCYNSRDCYDHHYEGDDCCDDREGCYEKSCHTQRCDDEGWCNKNYDHHTKHSRKKSGHNDWCEGEGHSEGWDDEGCFNEGFCAPKKSCHTPCHRERKRCVEGHNHEGQSHGHKGCESHEGEGFEKDCDDWFSGCQTGCPKPSYKPGCSKPSKRC